MKPEPIYKGVFVQKQTGVAYKGYFLKHDPSVGETPGDDCLLTVPLKLEGGAENCGDTGVFPPEEFASQFVFAIPPK